ncbi:MAG: hypothetical protein ACK4L7_02210 [Flavobacteriales bacterium]
MKHSSTALLGRIAQWAVMVLGVLFIAMIWSGSDAGISGGLTLTYVALGIATAVTLGFAVMGLNRKSLIGIGAFAAVLAGAYLLSDGTVKPSWNLSATQAKLIGAGIGMAIFAMAAAVGVIVYGEITRMLK